VIFCTGKLFSAEDWLAGVDISGQEKQVGRLSGSVKREIEAITATVIEAAMAKTRIFTSEMYCTVYRLKQWRRISPDDCYYFVRYGTAS
jgi:hypothetical protein